jgi:hypothetical protein
VKRRDAAALLASLERIGRRHAPGLPARKLVLLDALSRASLATPRQVLRLHELLSFLEAYPDNRRIHGRARRMLQSFSRRADLRRHRGSLTASGIAGTDTPFRFFFPTAQWITQHWPGALVLDRDDEEAIRDLIKVLPLLLEPAQAEWIAGQQPKDLDFSPFERLIPHGMTDADFVNGLIAGMPGDEFSREAFGDRLDLSYVLRAGRNTPERTTARFATHGPIHFQEMSLRKGYPDLRQESRRRPLHIRTLRGSNARAVIRLARISMITRERDLAAFQFANPEDVFLVDDGRGLVFAMMGVIPARRATLTTAYTALTLKNGVPIGYIQADVVGRHGALSFNTFEAFRGAEAAHVFARFIAASHHLFGCTTFSVEPYQLGVGNDEGIESGAWWFYQRFGFRPRTQATRRLAAREIARRKANRFYRSSAQTLRALARSHMLLSLDRSEAPRMPRIDAWLAASVRELRQFRQADPAERRAAASAGALQRLAGKGSVRLSADAHAMLGRWAGLVLAMSASGAWTTSERRQLLRLIVAKAGRNERSYQRLVLRHQRFRQLLGC